MNKSLLWGLLLLALAMIVMLLSKGTTEVHLVFATLRAAKAVIFFGFLATGVAIGLLLK